MKKFKILVTALILLVCVVLPLQTVPSVFAAYTPPASNRVVFNFNLDWKFMKQNVTGAEQVSFDDSSWAMVSAPHTFNDVDSFDEWILDTSAGGEKNVWEGIVWYRKHFKLDSAYAGRKVFLEFEGVRQAAFIYVNGTSAGRYEHGVTPFGFDITAYVNFGTTENVIAVKIDSNESYQEISSGSTYEWNNRRFNPMFGGLTRNINLYLMDKVYQTLPLYSNLGTSGTYIYPSNISTQNRTADITVESQVKNDYTVSKTVSLEAVIVDMAGNSVKTLTSGSYAIPAGGVYTFTATGNLTDVKLWEPGYPYLYKVYNILKEGATVLDVSPITTGFRKAHFRGGADTGGVFINNKLVFLTGYAQRATNEWAGVGAAVPDWMHDYYDGQLIRASNANFIRWMHISGEPVDIRTCDRYGIAVAQPAGDHESDASGRQWEQRKEVMRDNIIYFRNDPSIVLWEAGNNGISDTHMSEMKNLKALWDPKGMRAMGCRSLSDTAVNYAEYSGTMLAAPYTTYKRDLVPIVECEYIRDESPRRCWDNYSPPDFDYIRDPACAYDWTSEQFACQSAAQFNNYWKDRVQGPGADKFSGWAALVWADSNQHGRQPNTENARMSGRVDAVRLPKESFYAYKVVQNSQPDIHVVGHWTYPAGTTKTVYVIASNCAKVELFVNGVSKGVDTTATNGFEYSFPSIAWQSGTIKAVGYDSNNNILCQTQKDSAGTTSAVKLTAMTGPNGLRANGEDLAVVDVEVVDSQGKRCPTDQARIDFTISGPGTFEGGWNSGVQYSVHKTYLNTECGINRVFIRATRTAGTITLTATRSGLTQGSVNIISNAVSVTNGLTTEMPAIILPTLPPVMPTYGPDNPYTSTPTPTPAPGTIYEAENATLSGAIIGNLNTGYSGTGYADYTNASGDYVEWTVNTASAGTYTLEFRYANADSGGADRPLELKVNGAVKNSSLSFPNTGSWTSWSSVNQSSVSLNAGNNPVRLTAIGSSGGNLDYLKVIGGGGNTPTPTPTPALTATPTPTPTATPTPTPGTGTLLSQGKTASASSTETGNVASNANDGNTTSTRWAASGGTYPQWWKVDLGASYGLTRVESYWYNSATKPRSYQYKIEVSADNSTFTTVVDKTGNTTQDFTSDSFTATGRYVRITVTGNSSTGYASAYEFKVFGN